MPNDAIDLSTAVLAAPDCPDVRSWPIHVALTSVEFAASQRFERGDTMVSFVERDSLPPATGSQGAISYTLWIGCRINGTWYVAAAVECIQQYVPTGQLLAPGQIGDNILYYVNSPLKNHQPQPGESILLFCTTGDTRRQNAQAVQIPWRTNAVLVPLRVGVYDFLDGATTSTPSTPPPTSVPTTNIPTPVSSTPGGIDIGAVLIAQRSATEQLTLKIAALETTQLSMLQILDTLLTGQVALTSRAEHPFPAFPTYTGSLFGARVRLVPDLPPTT